MPARYPRRAAAAGPVQSVAAIAAVEGWLMAQVSADLLFALLLQNGSERYAERISSPLNTARAMLQLIGLQRVERPVESLADSLARREPETEREAASVLGSGSREGSSLARAEERALEQAHAGASAAPEVPPEGDEPTDPAGAAAPDGGEGEA